MKAKRIIIDGHEDIAFNTLEITGKDFLGKNDFNQSNLLQEPQLNQADYNRLVVSGVKIIFGVIFPYKSNSKHFENNEEIGMQETERQINFYNTLADESKGKIIIIKSKLNLEKVLSSDTILGIVLLLEDAIGIRRDFSNLEKFYNKGLRIIGPVWNKDNQFGGGTNTDHNLSPLGKELLQKMENLNMTLDTAHMNEIFFEDALNAFGGVIINSHTCVHTLNPHRRNLNDNQIKKLAIRNAVIGIAFVPEFLNKNIEKANINDVFAHIKHIIEIAGDNTVAFGSDFDGMSWPNYLEGLKDSKDFDNIFNLLTEKYSAETVDKITHKNWLQILEKIFN